MDKTSIIVCSVIGSLGLLSAILGFSAEGTKLTPYSILEDGYDCIYPPNPAIGLGICAAVFLLVAQVVFSAVSGCCGCCRSRPIPSETKRIVAIVCAVFSWIAAVIAFALFIDGAALNASVVRVGQAPYCTYLKDGVFAGAAVLALAATALGIASYVLMRTKRVKAAAPAAPVVVPAEGEPKLLPPPAAATQGSGSPGNQELQRPPADTVPPAAAMASAPPEPVELTPPAVAGMCDQPPPVQLPPQVGLPNDTIQYPVQQGPDEHLIRNELTKAGIRLAARVVEHSLFSDTTTMPGVGDILDSMTDLQST